MEEFKNLEQLYNRVKPALKVKSREIQKLNNIIIPNSTIWEYLADKKWKFDKNLSLDTIVDDILNTKNDEIIHFYERRIQGVK